MTRQAEPARPQVANILESITDAFFAVDSNWRLTYVNKRAEPLLRQRRQRLIDENLWQVFPEVVDTAVFILHRAMAEQKAVEFQEFLAPFGRWFYIRAYPYQDGLAIYCRDITERKGAERRLRESEERYRSLFESAPIGIFHSLPEGRFLRVNPWLAKMAGYDSTEAMVSSITDIDSQLYVDSNIRPELVKSVLEKDEWVFAESRYRRWDGSVISANLSLRRVLNPDGALAYLEGFVEDITERKRVEEFRQEYVSLISHGLRQPLTTIMGMAGLLRRQLVQEGSGQRAHVAELIETSGRNMNAMIQEAGLVLRRIEGQARDQVNDCGLLENPHGPLHLA